MGHDSYQFRNFQHDTPQFPTLSAMAYPGFQWSPENGKRGSGSTMARPCSGTSCSFSLWYSNLSGIFGQLKCKHLYDSGMRQSASLTVKEQVHDKSFVWC